MNGGRAPKRQGGGEDVPPVLGLGIMAFGGLAFGWWQLGHEMRMQWLGRIARASGYGPVPQDMVEQIEWLAANRLNDLQGMFLLFVLTATAGVLEGNARRRAEALSGFGLRRLQIGRVLVLVWLVLVALSIGVPLPLPFGWVGAALSLLLGLATYNVGRGLRRVH